MADNETTRYYAKNAEQTSRKYESSGGALESLFDSYYPPGAKILDIGCGSGRDLAMLLSKGYDAFGVDPVPEMLDVALRCHTELAGRLSVAGLPNLGRPFGGEFDGILCCAVLMHLNKTELSPSIRAMREVLRPNGRVLVSYSSDRPGLTIDSRDESGRLFVIYDAETMASIFKDEGFNLIEQSGNVDTLGRTGINWTTQLFEI
jgi:SAM-dependent methyltransferase